MRRVSEWGLAPNSDDDFIVVSSDGTKTEIDITRTSPKEKASLVDQANKIDNHVTSDLDNAKDPSKARTVCDLSEFPEHFRGKAYLILRD